MIKDLKYITILLLLFLFTYSIHAQQATISGIITDPQKQPVIGAVVQLNNQHHTTSDIEGRFTLSQLSKGNYSLSVQSLGLKKYQKQITLKQGQNLQLKIQMEVDVKMLNTVTIEEKSVAQETREKGFSVEVIETKSIKNITSDINQVLKSTSGINIRETGGLGSGFKLSLNGLSGNQIRYFIDGVPMENFGSALSLNNFPVNQIERIEVFKGVVPIALGADALGGAINIISGYQQQSYLDASYSIGSFNTHIASVNGQYADRDKGYFIKVLSFFNHSDNDYEMKSVPLYDLKLGNKLGKISIKRFNSAYTSGMLVGEAGIFGKRYADLLSLKITHARNLKHYQHPDNNILRPMGDFKSKSASSLLSLSYKKRWKRLQLKSYVLGGLIQEDVIDTSTFKYNWAGDRVPRPEDNPKGELFERRSWFQLTDKVIRSQFHAEYTLDSIQSLNFSIAQNYIKRSGKDKVDELNRSFSSPSSIHKNTLGLSYTIKNKSNTIEATVFGKQYFYSGEITTIDTENKSVISKPTLSKAGYGLTFTYKPIRDIALKTSVEKAYRLPETYEILGNGIYVRPNPKLEPEQSINFNAGAQFKERIYDFRLQQEVKFFYRQSEKFIRFSPLGPFGNYENLNSVNTTGIEGQLLFDYKRLIELQCNATYQNLTDQTKFDEGLRNTHYQDRIPNTPYLFGNSRIGVRPFRKGKHKSLAFYWNTQYVHQFFLTWESNGNKEDKHIIPAQLTHGMDLEYSLKDGQYNFSLSIINLTDELVYDNFNIQKPGRAIYLKARYFLSKQ